MDGVVSKMLFEESMIDFLRVIIGISHLCGEVGHFSQVHLFVTNYCMAKYTMNALGIDMFVCTKCFKTHLTNNQNPYLVMQPKEYF